MSRTLHLILQIMAVIIQAVMQAHPDVHSTFKVIHIVIISALQGFLGIIAHNWNPDGTSCRSAYQTKRRTHHGK